MKKLFIIISIFIYIISSFISFSSETIDRKVIVEIRGEVKNEKLIKVPLGYKFSDILDNIGLLETSDISQISLNSVLYNNQIIYIPKKSDINLISINSATLTELIKLPGIGETIANRIIEYRKDSSFKYLEELKNVSGIGDKMYEKIKQYICL